MTECGGCQGLGSHKRWCKESVGLAASLYGSWSEQIESIADSVGSNNIAVSNHLYIAASMLREQAMQRRDEFRAAQ